MQEPSHQFTGHPHEQYAADSEGGHGGEHGGPVSSYDEQQKSTVKRWFGIVVLLWSMIEVDHVNSHTDYMFVVVIMCCVFFTFEFFANASKSEHWGQFSHVRRGFIAVLALWWSVNVFLFTNLENAAAGVVASNGWVSCWIITISLIYDFLVTFELYERLFPSDNRKAAALTLNIFIGVISTILSWDTAWGYVLKQPKRTYGYFMGPIALLFAVTLKMAPLADNGRKILAGLLVAWWAAAVMVLSTNTPGVNMWAAIWLGWISSMIHMDAHNPLEIVANFQPSGVMGGGVGGGYNADNNNNATFAETASNPFNEAGGYNSGVPAQYDPVVPQGQGQPTYDYPGPPA